MSLPAGTGKTIAAMCAIGRDQTTSIAGNSARSTMLGGAAIGTSTAPGARRVAGGIRRGTLLGGAGDTRPGVPGSRDRFVESPIAPMQQY